MIIIISPAKTLDFSKQDILDKYTLPVFLDHSKILMDELRKFSPAEIMKLMKVSSKLAYLNYGRYQDWQLPFSPKNSKQALLAFKGEVYTGINVDSYNKEDINYAQKHLRILSGLYGFLRPLDLIQAYRLEMGTSFKTKKWTDLYEFWGNKITDILNEEFNSKSDVLINLASNEYFRAIKKDLIKADIITPVFKEYKNGTYKFLSVYGKKARGLMTSYIIKNKISDHEKLKLFDIDGYYFNDRLSRENEWVFTRG